MSMIEQVPRFGQKLFKVHELIVRVFVHMLFYEQDTQIWSETL